MAEAALLAILALSPEMRRPRPWLKDKLWGDRFVEQGAMGLCRALANIRKSFGPARAALCADKRAVRLGQVVRIRHNTNITADDFHAELSIADPKFEQWHLEAISSLADNTGEGAAAPRFCLWPSVRGRPDQTPIAQTTR